MTKFGKTIKLSLLSKETGLSSYMLRKFIKEGKLKAIKTGRDWLVLEESARNVFGEIPDEL